MWFSVMLRHVALECDHTELVCQESERHENTEVNNASVKIT